MSRDPDFDRPLFIISAPRSGSTLLFETLAQARGLYTIGRESHKLIETIPELNVGAHNLDSNRLLAEHAVPHVTRELRRRFMGALRDRDGAAPRRKPVRMLEKTPKNALRVPFLMAAFPEAHFIVLLREPRQVLSSMLEAWQSGRFRTYPRLPEWRLPSWSLLLTPGWRDLAGSPLPEIVAAQWEAATRIMLDDIEALSKDRWTLIRYDAFIGDWGGSVSQLCGRLELNWDRPLTGALAHSRYTVSAPDPDKWRRHEAQFAPLLPRLRGAIERVPALRPLSPGAAAAAGKAGESQAGMVTVAATRRLRMLGWLWPSGFCRGLASGTEIRMVRAFATRGPGGVLPPGVHRFGRSSSAQAPRVQRKRTTWHSTSTC